MSWPFNLIGNVRKTDLVFSQPNAGAIARPIETKLQELAASPLDFQCVGDGITDDTINLQNAIDACLLRGLELDGLGRSYLVSDVAGIISGSRGSWREDRGLAVSGGLRLSNITLILATGAARYTSILNLYTGPGQTTVLRNVNLRGNGHSQSPSGAAREDGGLHGIRTYGNDDGAAGRKFGSLILQDVTVDNFYSDGITIRPIAFEQLTMNRVVVTDCGRNGITYNSRSFATLNAIQTNRNGWRAGPSTGFHYEPDTGDVGDYAGIVGDGFIALDNYENGVKFDLRITAGVASIGPIKMSSVVALRNGVAHGSPSHADFGVVSNGANAYSSISLANSTIGICRCTNATAGSANPPVRSLSLNGVNLEGYLRVENSGSSPIEYLRVTGDYVNRDASYAAFAAIEVVGVGGVSLMDVDVGTISAGSNYYVKADAFNASTLTPYGGRLNFRAGRILGSKTPSRFNGFREVYIKETDFGPNTVDARTAQLQVVSISRSRFNSRESSDYFVRAEACRAFRMDGTWLRDVTAAGTAPAGNLNAYGSAIATIQSTVVESSAGAVTALTV